MTEDLTTIHAKLGHVEKDICDADGLARIAWLALLGAKELGQLEGGDLKALLGVVDEVLQHLHTATEALQQAREMTAAPST
ncbi:hypothetical protein [Marinivivus vitaminiproducens]|uniref:hypothetical protein n=1 Tax=Marinivivus vitaminiproducens TaxID=3035935 RepID=UPI0027A329E0|nr:hypothetical protein P4R82_08120 [Geminicoccaceae bacterium SCSIO 64248]